MASLEAVEPYGNKNCSTLVNQSLPQLKHCGPDRFKGAELCESYSRVCATSLHSGICYRRQRLESEPLEVEHQLHVIKPGLLVSSVRRRPSLSNG
jgi:hypothetical protein